MTLNWEDGFRIAVRIENGTVVISANQAGLQSLSNHCLSLMREQSGGHFHLGPYNSLEDGSAELIVEKTE